MMPGELPGARVPPLFTVTAPTVPAPPQSSGVVDCHDTGGGEAAVDQKCPCVDCGCARVGVGARERQCAGAGLGQSGRTAAVLIDAGEGGAGVVAADGERVAAVHEHVAAASERAYGARGLEEEAAVDGKRAAGGHSAIHVELDSTGTIDYCRTSV